MKKIFTLIGLVFILAGCDKIEERGRANNIIASNSYKAEPYGNVGENVRVYKSIIDKHEYLIVYGDRSMGITHKADCKFCKELK